MTQHHNEKEILVTHLNLRLLWLTEWGIRGLLLTIMLLLSCGNIYCYARKGKPSKLAKPIFHATFGANWSLNGQWLMCNKAGQSYSRTYDTVVLVPGVQLSPKQMGNDPIWFYTTIDLRADSAIPTDLAATIRLNGARFCPTLYVNGQLVGQQQGGMAPVDFVVPNRFWRAGELNRLEIKLLSLLLVPKTDASNIPDPDRWRSNVSACLWDDVSLRWHSDRQYLKRVIPAFDSSLKTLKLGLHVGGPVAGDADTMPKVVLVTLQDKQGRVVVSQRFRLNANDTGWHTVAVKLPQSCIRWSPDRPYLYQLTTSIVTNTGSELDRLSFPFGIKYVGIQNDMRRKGLVWNGRPFEARSISVVWHRWVRDPEAKDLAYNAGWFKANILKRSKDIGANMMRFHLGTPPERYLHWCDSMGFAVQFEWLFFHGMKADRASLLVQWQQWLDLAARHPSIAIIHPWNETEGPELATSWSALNTLLPDYQRLIVAERDILHIHKYWWGLFENLGLYYDDARQFPLPIMVDEFGGNYLDGNNDLGGYKTLHESYLRFLGHQHIREQRLKHHTIANGRVAEYWRRIGAAGYSPFCALGSPEDGNHWFLGPLKDGKPKPVWAALTPAYSPVGISLDLWDRHYVPNQRLKLSIVLTNNKFFPHQAIWQVQILNGKGQIISRSDHSQFLLARSQQVVLEPISMPIRAGQYTIKAWLKNPPKEIKYPVVSAWDIKVISPKVPLVLVGKTGRTIFIHAAETELLAFAKQFNLRLTADPSKADVGLGSRVSWVLAKAQGLPDQSSIKQWVWLDMGPQSLGQGYPAVGVQDAMLLGPTQAVANVAQPRNSTDRLVGYALQFAEVAEPESHIHLDTNQVTRAKQLFNLAPEDLWLFNGLRGGLAIPAWDMKVMGLKPEAVKAAWVSRGANVDMLSKAAPYYAYELGGYYAFSLTDQDKATESKLRARVRFLLEDAPALKNVLNPHGRINKVNLNTLPTIDGAVTMLQPLLVAGKGLTKTPAALIRLDNGQQHIFSQIISQQRLAKNAAPAIPQHNHGQYKASVDPALQQLVLNWLAW